MNELVMLGEISLAMALAGAIGFDRAAENKPAGFRTHMLVAGVAAMLVGLGDRVLDHYGDRLGTRLIATDPMRIIQAVITGISFLGAGTIFRRGGEHVEGLTTAATILLASAIGIAVAVHQMVLAVGVTALTLFVLRALKVVERRISSRPTPQPASAKGADDTPNAPGRRPGVVAGE